MSEPVSIPIYLDLDVSQEEYSLSVDNGITAGLNVETEFVVEDPDAQYENVSNVTVNPVLSVDYDTGEISAVNNGTASISPILVAGHAEPTDELSVQVSGNVATQLYTLDATVYTPSKTDEQIIYAGQFLVGDQTILKIPDQYYDSTAELAWMGPNATHLGTFYTKDYLLKDTGFNTWTPVTTASPIVDAISDCYHFVGDISKYEYFIRWRCEFTNAFLPGATLKAQIDKQVASHWILIHRRPYGFDSFSTMTDTRPYSLTVSSQSTYVVYWNTSGTYSWTTNNTYGIYQTMGQATFSSNSSNTPTITIPSPSVSARCYSSFFATARAYEVDKNNATVKLRGDLYRIDKGFGQIRHSYIDAIDLYNNPIV